MASEEEVSEEVSEEVRPDEDETNKDQQDEVDKDKQDEAINKITSHENDQLEATSEEASTQDATLQQSPELAQQQLQIQSPTRTMPMRQAKRITILLVPGPPLVLNPVSNQITAKSTATSTRKSSKAGAKESGNLQGTSVNGEGKKKASPKKGKRRASSGKSSGCQVFFCDRCDKVYDHYSELVYHQRRHTGEKPFACDWPGCTAAFSASNARVRHMRIHTGEKPYTCPHAECGRKFTYWKDLKLHKYRHSGEKPHICDWEGCSARFFRRDDLKHHKYTHTGEKPYKCKFPGCDASFSQKSPLNLHMKKIHKVTEADKLLEKQQKQQPNLFTSTSGEYPLYPTISNNGLRSGTSNLAMIPDDHHGMMAVNHPHNIEGSNYIGVDPTDKSDSILVTCDVSPATVHGVSHHFNPDARSQWSAYHHTPLNQTNGMHSLPPPSHSLARESHSSNGEPPKADNQHHISHLPVLNDLLSAPHPVRSGDDERPIIPNCDDMDLHDDDEAISRDTSNINVMDASMNQNLDGTNESTENASSKNNPDDVNMNVGLQSQPFATNPKGVKRKRTNYRLKVPPPEGSKIGEVEIIRNKSAIESKSKSKTTPNSEEKAGRRNAKRTIAIQTLKKQSVEKLPKDAKWKCDYCEREFKTKHDRDCHQMTHTGEKPRACEYPGCNYRCITKSKLTRHQRKHTGEKNYPCEWPGCGKKFSTSRHLKEHKRCHTGEKPFKCDWPGCDKYFTRKDHIKNHRFTHTGEKPRKCPYPGCDAAFIQLSPLKKHMELHKREGGHVPNRTRKRKTSMEQMSEDDEKSNMNCITPQANMDAVTLEAMVTSRMMPHNSMQSFNMMTGQENQSCCSIAYDNIHTNQPNHEYEVMFRHPAYC